MKCIVDQDDLHHDMIGRKKAVRVRYLELQQELEQLQQLKEQRHLDGLKQIEQYADRRLIVAVIN